MRVSGSPPETRTFSVGDVYVGLMVLVSAVPLAAALRPIRDVDIYWHKQIGEEILRERNVIGVGDSWAWYDPERPWTTSQWLSEVAIALIVRAQGWNALVVATMLLTASLLGILAWQVLARTSARSGIVIYTAVAFSLIFLVDVRPLLVSTVATAGVAHYAERLLSTGRTPPWWWLPLVALWANLHGQWLVAPLAFGLAAFLHHLGNRAEDRRGLARNTLFLAATVLVGMANPLGWRSLVLPFEFAQSTSHLQEWQLTTPWNPVYAALAVLMAVVLWAWVVRGAPNWTVIAYVLFWVAFSLLAFRNVLVATLMMVPVAASAQGHPDPAGASRRLAMLPVVLPVLFVVGIVGVGIFRIDALSQAMPLQIAEKLAERTESTRILNDYNTAGVLVAFGGDRVVLGIDGRAERFGKEYIEQYSALYHVTGQEWPELLAELDPLAAVVDADSAVRHVLVDDMGWVVSLRDGPYILIEPPQNDSQASHSFG